MDSVDCRGRGDPQTRAISHAGPESGNCPDTPLGAVPSKTGPHAYPCAILLPVRDYVTILESIACMANEQRVREILFPLRRAITLEPSAPVSDPGALAGWTWLSRTEVQR